MEERQGRISRQERVFLFQMNTQVLGNIIRLKRPYLQLPTDGAAI